MRPRPRQPQPGADVLDARAARIPALPALALGVLVSLGCMQPYRQSLDPQFMHRVREQWPDIALVLNADDIDRLYHTSAIVALTPEWDRAPVRVVLSRSEKPEISVPSHAQGVAVSARSSGVGQFRPEEGKTRLVHVVRLYVSPPASIREGYPLVTAFADGEQIEHVVVGYSQNFSIDSPRRALGIGNIADDVGVQALEDHEPFGGETVPLWKYSVIAPAQAELSFLIRWRDNPGPEALD